MNEENMCLPSDSDLVDEIKALKIENFKEQNQNLQINLHGKN